MCLENLSADDTSLSPGETATITYDITGDEHYECKIVSGITDAAKPATDSPEQIDYDELASPGTNTIKVGCRVAGDADGLGAFDDMTETITITKASGPTAVDDGTSDTIDVDQCSDSDGKVIDVLANDSDPDNDDLEITAITSQPDHGSVSIIQNGDKVEYTPPSNYTGSVTFAYKVSDGNGGTDTAQVTINVTSSGCNDAPNAVDDGTSSDPVCVMASTPTDINVLSNDSDPNGDDLFVSKVDGTNVSTGDTVYLGGGNAVSVLDADAGDLRFFPGPGNQSGSFTYTAADGNGDSSTATVIVSSTCGEIEINVQDTGNNPVSGASGAASYNGNSYNLNGKSSVSHSVPLFDSPKDAVLRCSDINPPAGYQCKRVGDPVQPLSF